MSDFPLTRVQKLIGQRMLQSKREIPCFYIQRQVDLTELSSFRKGRCRKSGIKASTNDFFFKAIATAIVQYPLIAGRLSGDNIVIAESVGVGFAVDSPAGLVVPVVKEVQNCSLNQIAQQSARLTQDARSGKLTLEDLSGACISLSSLGMFGLTNFIAIVPPGQASILSIGRIIDAPIFLNGGIAVRKMMNITAAVDHRFINGVYAAKFLGYIVELLENPALLL